MKSIDLPVAWSTAFVIAREPMPKPRPRTRVIPGPKPYAMIYTPTEAIREEEAIDARAAAFAPPSPWPGPVVLHVEAAIPIPSSFPKWEHEAAVGGKRTPTARGSSDADNLAKLLQDALSRSNRWWNDDSQVVECLARKVYAAEPRWTVEVYFLEHVTTAVRWKELKTGQRAPVTGDLFAHAVRALAAGCETCDGTGLVGPDGVSWKV